MSRAVPRREDAQLDAVAAGTFDDPFAVLGRHETRRSGRPAVVVRTMQPAASRVELVTPEGITEMERRRSAGLFEVTVPLAGALTDFAYRVRVHDGLEVREILDPYQFGQVLTDFDLHLFSAMASPAFTLRSGRRTPSA
jgi:1,4-alpha-glucan branching enzyme